MQVGLTWTGKGSAGVKWWLLDLGAEMSRATSATQTIKVSLEPMIFDDAGKPLEFLVAAPDVPLSAGEVDLDPPDDPPRAE